MSDFESGLLSAVAAKFQNAVHKGCHLHFSQAIYRKVQAFGLAGVYDSEPDVQLQMRQLMALAFPSRSNIVRLTYQTLQLKEDDRLQPLFRYFEQQWLTAVRPHLWDVYGQNLRTNNDYEGWHVRFSNAIRRHHPNIMAVGPLHARRTGCGGGDAAADNDWSASTSFEQNVSVHSATHQSPAEPLRLWIHHSHQLHHRRELLSQRASLTVSVLLLCWDCYCELAYAFFLHVR